MFFFSVFCLRTLRSNANALNGPSIMKKHTYDVDFVNREVSINSAKTNLH